MTAYARLMGVHDLGPQQRWDQIIGGMRTLLGVGTLALFIVVAVPVLLNQVPPFVLLLAAWSSLGWLLTWFLRRPPRGWHPPADFGRAEQSLARMRKVSLIHLAVFGSIDAILLLLLLVRAVRLP